LSAAEGERMSDEDCDAIAEFIRSKGITRCPTACVSPTQASVGAADRAALEKHAATRDRLFRARAATNWGKLLHPKPKRCRNTGRLSIGDHHQGWEVRDKRDSDKADRVSLSPRGVRHSVGLPHSNTSTARTSRSGEKPETTNPLQGLIMIRTMLSKVQAREVQY